MRILKQPIFIRYRNSEFLQYLSDVVQLVQKYDIAALELTEQRDALVMQLETLAMAFEAENEEKHTKTLQQLDTQRDELYVGIRHLLKGNTYHIDAAKQEAAKRLLFDFETYGKNVNRMPYQQQTALIANMMSEWQTAPDLRDAVELLELSEWVTAMQYSNTEFSKLFVKRITDIAANDLPSFTSLRTGAQAVYRTLMERLKAFVTLKTHEDHEKLYHEIYELARQYNLVVMARRKKPSQKA